MKKCSKYKVKNIDGKLQLTSTDIQVGDKVWCEDVHNGNLQNPNMYIDPWRIRTETCTCAACIKVIGEISPDALSYVEEGQEFDEEDFRYITWYSITSLDDNAGYSKLSPFQEGKKKDWSKIAIKGPCGHFH